MLRNITVKNMALTGVTGDGYGVTGKRTCAYVQVSKSQSWRRNWANFSFL